MYVQIPLYSGNPIYLLIRNRGMKIEAGLSDDPNP
jgi:hypothetical protein